MSWDEWMRGVEVEPSLYAADMSRLGEQVEVLLDGGVRIFHFDVGDGHFVEPIIIGPIVLQSIAERIHDGGALVDVHLMVESPQRYFEPFREAGADSVTFHYEAVEDVRAALEGMLKPEEKDVVLGDAEVRQLFKISGVGVIAGCYVKTGTIPRAGKVRVIRDAATVYEGVLSSLKRFKDDVKEVKEGYECGIGIENFNDVKVGDVLECYRKETVARTLQPAAAG